jgi:hypothetical protein
MSVEALQESVRKTAEEPPRVSVVDVIAAAKECSTKYAAQLYQRLRADKRVPDVELAPPALFDTANCSAKKRGGAK